MHKLILKTLLLLLLVIAINQLIFSFIKVPFSWGSYFEKEYCLEKNASQYNTVLFGSSRVHRQINSMLFDSINSIAGDTTTSINFGNDAMTMPEVYFQFENVLRIPNLKPRYIIVELCDVDTFASVNLHTTRKKYYYSAGVWWNSVSMLCCSDYSLSRQLSGCFSHCINFMETLLKYNFLSEMAKFSQNEKTATYPCNPFYSPLDNDDTAQIFFSGKMCVNPHIAFLKHPQQLEELKKKSELLFEKYASDESKSTPNKFYLDLVERMLKKGREKSIKIIFFLPPKLEEIHYKNVLPVFNAIPTENKIDLANPAKHEKFYKLEYAFDLGHVNKNGATLLTEKLSEEFIKLSEVKK